MINTEFSDQIMHELFFFNKKPKRKEYEEIVPQIPRKEALTKFTNLVNKRLSTNEECCKLLRGKIKVNPKIQGKDAYDKFINTTINTRTIYARETLTVVYIRGLRQYYKKTYKGKYIDQGLTLSL